MFLHYVVKQNRTKVFNLNENHPEKKYYSSKYFLWMSIKRENISLAHLFECIQWNINLF